MKCPQCGGLDDRVANGRQKADNTIMRRRRECLACQHRWTTYEFMADSLKDKEDCQSLMDLVDSD